MDNNNDNIIDNLDTPENITKEYEDETTYKAHNKEINANKKVSKIATQAAGTYFGGKVGGKIVSALNNTKIGDKLNEKVGKSMQTIANRTGIGRKVQNTITDLDDKGALDAGNSLTGNNDADNQDLNSQKNESNQKSQQVSNEKLKITPKKSLINASNEQKNKITQKKIIQFIIKHPWVIYAILIIFILMLILLIILGAGAFDNEGSVSFLNGCSEFPMKSTTLSKNDFVELINQNLTSTANGPTVFRNNAGKIYDIATKNNVNPELVVVRAEMEGYSGGNNNYWGIGAYNGQMGFSYSSFDEGVLAFVNLVSQYSTIREMMSTYANIGKYWYNAGNWGLGGCQYIDYIKDYYSNSSRYEEVKEICSKNACPWNNNNGTIVVSNTNNCVLTTEEDQYAYTSWQVQKMLDSRKRIFNLEPDQCISTGLFGNFERCTIFNQVDPNWKSMTLGKTKTTMTQGCAVTSISIGISCFSSNFNSTFNPAVFLNLANSDSYVEQCFYRNPNGVATANIYWTCPAIQTFAPNIRYVAGVSGIISQNDNQKVAFINNYNSENHFFIVQIINEKTSTHFVVLKSIDLSSGTFICLNPSGGKITTEKIKDINSIRVYSR